MAASIVDLEDGYLKALHEVIVETEQALWDVSWINAHYVSQVITVMSSWQEAVQTAASHMEGIDTTIYLACHEDARKATQGIRGGCREGQRRVRCSSRSGAGSPETSPEGRRSRRPLSPSPGHHLTSGPCPV